MSKQTIIYPLGQSRSVTIHPHIQWGNPTVRGTRITTYTLYGMFSAGDTMATIAGAYDLTPEQVEDAIRYEVMRRCKHGRKRIKRASVTVDESTS